MTSTKEQCRHKYRYEQPVKGKSVEALKQLSNGSWSRKGKQGKCKIPPVEMGFDILMKIKSSSLLLQTLSTEIPEVPSSPGLVGMV